MLYGCGMILSLDTTPEMGGPAEEAGKIPEWLLAKHRISEITVAESNDEPLKPKDPDDETGVEGEETEGSGNEEDDSAAEKVEEKETVKEREKAPAEDEEGKTERVTDKAWKEGTYTGEWQDGKPNGNGTFEHTSGGKLSGSWVNGKPHGLIRVTHPNGETETIRFDHGKVVDDSDWWKPGNGGASMEWDW